MHQLRKAESMAQIIRQRSEELSLLGTITKVVRRECTWDRRKRTVGAVDVNE